MSREDVVLNEKVVSKYSSVRVTGDFEDSGKVMYSRDALDLAYDMGFDLVLVNANVVPVICKIHDHKKFVYEQKKMKKAHDKKQKEINKPMKEIQLGPNIASNDIETKKKHIIEFLEDGHVVNVIMKFRRFELKHSDRGLLVVVKLADDLSSIAKVDEVPKLVGDRISIKFTKLKK